MKEISNLDNLISVGYIKSVFGVKGWLKIISDTASKENILDYNPWFLCRDDIIREVELEDKKILSSNLQVKFSNIDTRDDAEKLIGYTIKVSRSNFKELNNNEYYYVDLIGLDVFNLNNEYLGKVIDIKDIVVHSILVIDTNKKEELLIPFVAKYIVDVILEAKKIIIDWE